MRFSFQVDRMDIGDNLELLVAALMGSLQSHYLDMPRGVDFVEYSSFQTGYECLRQSTGNFTRMDAAAILECVFDHPMALIVLRTMLGFSPPEWAYEASTTTRVNVSAGYARSLERRIRSSQTSPLRRTETSLPRIRALVETACAMLTRGNASTMPSILNRLDKADTASGLASLAQVASIGVPYPMLLYERFLGRPFASHRDAVSELVADVMEAPIEQLLSSARIPYRKVKRAEAVVGFDQAPDFIIPDEYAPAVVIEAKVTEDEGTARDKITRVQHLAELSHYRERDGKAPFQVVACVDGRGFTRKSDLEKLILATDGKVFTLRTLSYMVENTLLSGFAVV